MRHEEHEQQVRFFQMMEMLGDRDEAFLTFAVPNGARFISNRHASRVREEGMKSGVPDIICAVPRGGEYCGLAIEMKIPPNKSTPTQVKWQMMLARKGWRVAVCHSAEEAFVEWADYNRLDVQHYGLVARNFLFGEYVVGGA